MHARSILALFAVLLLTVAETTAAPPSFAKELAPMLDALGGTIEVAPPNHGTVITITLNCDRVMQSIPLLQATGIVNSDLDVAYINTHQNVLSVGIANSIAALTAMYFFKHTSAKDATFNVGMIIVDDYGHDHRQPLFSFGFDRATYNKINWDNFDMLKLSKVSRGFKFSSWVLQHGLEE